MRSLFSHLHDLRESGDLPRAIGLAVDQDERIASQRRDRTFDPGGICAAGHESDTHSGLRLPEELLFERRRTAACRDHAVIGLSLDVRRKRQILRRLCSRGRRHRQGAPRDKERCACRCKAFPDGSCRGSLLRRVCHELRLGASVP